MVGSIGKLEVDHTVFTDYEKLPCERSTYEALSNLLHYKFKNDEEIGKYLDRYNGALCVNILRESSKKVVKIPEKYLLLLRQMAKEYSTQPSHGLKVGDFPRNERFIHFLFEHDETKTTGVCFYDQKRPLSVRQVHDTEKSIVETGLTRQIIVANKIGIPAKNEVNRINSEYNQPIIKLSHFDSIEKRHLLNYCVA